MPGGRLEWNLQQPPFFEFEIIFNLKGLIKKSVWHRFHLVLAK
jgi:hypothetical protein